MEQLQPPGHCCEIRLTGRRQRHQRKGQVGPAATAGGGRGGKASTPALGPGEASERQRGLVFVQKAQELQGDSRGCPGPCSTARKGAVRVHRGRLQSLEARSAFSTALCCLQGPVVCIGSSCWGKSFVFQGAKLQPLLHQGLPPYRKQHRGLAEGLSPGTAPAGAALGTLAQEDEPRDRGDAAAPRPCRAPASLLLSGLGLGAASVQTESGPWSGFAPRGKRLLRAPDEGHARPRLAGNPGCTSSRSSHERFLLQLQS
nr:uncharacterized protein LOC106629329 isoform X3 [Zonotrichia albicollis]